MQRRSLYFQAELEQQRASALLDSYTAQRRLTHEFTNHISALRALLEQGDVAGAQDYIAGVDKRCGGQHNHYGYPQPAAGFHPDPQIRGSHPAGRKRVF